jgi:hypothetical protein
MKMIDEFERIKANHLDALRARSARAATGPSIIRVFAAGTVPGLRRVLLALPVDGLPDVVQAGRFEAWHEKQAERVARELRVYNAGNQRLAPGLKWGHATKVLNIYLRELVEHVRFYPDATAYELRTHLHVPIDGVLIDRMRELDVPVPSRTIKGIANREMYRTFQQTIKEAADTVGVPPVWFDDNWAERT